MTLPQLKSHPRLYATSSELDRLKLPATTPVLQVAEKTMQAEAEAGLHTTTIEYDPDTHNAQLIRARRMQKRIVSLAAMWWKTGEERYRTAILANVKAMGDWEYWSWITWRQGNNDPKAIFDLSYGENSATLAIAYDWLYASLSPDEKQLFVNIAQRRAIAPFLHHTEEAHKEWWFGKPDTNWNSVCVGGAGMLALAMREELPEADEVLRHVETSLAPFMYELDRTSGGWVEGLGYWNYGMRYAFMYLLSWEHATGEEHPLLDSDNVRRTLQFPLDFSPNGQACSFGDVANWTPLPFHFAMAERFGDKIVLAGLETALRRASLDDGFRPKGPWPDAAEILIFYPRAAESKSATPQTNVVKLYGGLDWGILADRLPEPKFYLSVRGGSSAVPHGQRDLLSFHCVVGAEKLIENISGSGGYLDTTFSGRRNELLEISPFSKNTLLINGVGVAVDSAVKIAPVEIAGFQGSRLDAAEAMGTMRDGAAAKVCERTFLQLANDAVLIVDRIQTAHPALVEARFFTQHTLDAQENHALITGKKEKLHIAFAANHDAVLQSTPTLLTWPQAEPHTMMRWITSNLSSDIVFATLLTPIEGRSVEIISDNGTAQKIVIHGAGIEREIALSEFTKE
jgi:hypothetical protein